MAANDYTITLNYQHRIRFSRDVFCAGNLLLKELLEAREGSKVLVFVEEAIVAEFSALQDQIAQYFSTVSSIELSDIITAPGAEECKRNEDVLRSVWTAIEENKIDRHSYVFAIGGGAFLDVIGFGAATAHRGVRLVRFPTTTLSQDDSGVGVKNGINAFGKKNWLGSFAVPYAVVNDFTFLHTQPEEIRRDGLIEAIKVALVRDADFFTWLEKNSTDLAELQPSALEYAVERSATLHAEHIAQGGDPFELGSSRPLDYGHWAAHKLEQLTGFTLTHAQAVSIGIALDSLYSCLTGRLSQLETERILQLLRALQMPLYHDSLELRHADGGRKVYDGLEEFREHLGGTLTIMLLSSVGSGEDVHSMDIQILEKSIALLQNYNASGASHLDLSL